MKLNLSILKETLLKVEENLLDEEENYSEWIKENIGEDEVSIREWLDEFNKFWCKVSDDYGDSEIIVQILVNEYKLSNDDMDKVMMEYWQCESIEEFKDDYDYNYNKYRY
jgi:hypothetical protein